MYVPCMSVQDSNHFSFFWEYEEWFLLMAACSVGRSCWLPCNTDPSCSCLDLCLPVLQLSICTCARALFPWWCFMIDFLLSRLTEGYVSAYLWRCLLCWIECCPDLERLTTCVLAVPVHAMSIPFYLASFDSVSPKIYLHLTQQSILLYFNLWKFSPSSATSCNAWSHFTFRVLNN